MARSWQAFPLWQVLRTTRRPQSGILWGLPTTPTPHFAVLHNVDTATPVVEVSASAHAHGTVSWVEAEAAIRTAKASNKGCLRVNVGDSFVGDDAYMPEDVECAAPELAGLGVDVIMLMDDPCSKHVGGDDVESALSGLQLDAGPGSWRLDERIGIRAQPSSVFEAGLGDAELQPSPFRWQEQVREAVRLRVRHYDYCPTGLKAPQLQLLVGLLGDLGVQHEFAPSTRQRLIAEYKQAVLDIRALTAVEAEYQRCFGCPPPFAGHKAERRHAMRVALVDLFVSQAFNGRL